LTLETSSTVLQANIFQYLAWNGGGSATKSEETVQILPIETIEIPSAEDDFEIPDVEEIKIIIEKARKDIHRGSRHMAKKIEMMAEEVEEFVKQEMEELFEDLI
jgi:hypothetical protein